MIERSSRADAPVQVQRAFPVQLQVRSSGAGSGSRATLTGYASVVERGYEMWDMFGSYTEVVRAGAFTKTLSETPSVQLLLNHGGLSMAATKAGSLQLSEDETGLHMEAEVNTERRDVADMVHALRDGDVDEMSFAFRIRRQQWSPDYDQRDILEVDLHRGDVSVVNFGANPSTSVQARGLDVDRLDDAGARALLERLQSRLAPPAPAVVMPLQAVLTRSRRARVRGSV